MENTVYFALTDSADLSLEVRRLIFSALAVDEPLLGLDENGKPYLRETPEVHISLSHTKGAVAVAVSENPVGIDLEHPRRVNPKLAVRWFTASERAYAVDDERRLEIWTRKEALLKRAGRLELPAGKTDTLGRADITTRKVRGFTLSFCGVPTEFTLLEVSL